MSAGTGKTSNRYSEENIVFFPVKQNSCEHSILVEGLKANQPASAARVYDLFAPRIHQRVWHMLGPDEEHDDLVQQVFLQIYSSINQLKDPASLEYWVSSITFNVVAKFLKKRSVRRIMQFEPDMSDTACGGVAEDDIESQVVLKSAFTVLNTMKRMDRMLFVMKYVERCTNLEISQASGLSLATVKRRILKSRDVFVKKAMRDSTLASRAKEILNEK